MDGYILLPHATLTNTKYCYRMQTQNIVTACKHKHKILLPYERCSAWRPPWSRLLAEPELHMYEFYRGEKKSELASVLAGLLGFIKFYSVLLSFTKFYYVLLCFIMFYYVLLSFIKFY